MKRSSVGERRLPGLVSREHTFSLPLDHARSNGSHIEVFARELVAPGRENDALPWLLFLQGGPGFGAPRPLGTEGWIKRALETYRVLLLDQRGTGRSTPVLAQTLARLDGPQAQADYLSHFRADSIVRDAEAVRRALIGKRRWTVLGQSYGGFCAVTYLSQAPEGLGGVLITGGLPPLARPAEDVYRATYRRVLDKNQRFYARYPENAGRARDIVEHLKTNEVALPGGGALGPRRFQQLGMGFGASDGFEQLHYLLEGAWVAGKGGPELSLPFLREVEAQPAFETHPIYALLHEAIYAQGMATNWAAQRVRQEFPEFSLDHEPLQFTGEMVYPSVFEDYAALRPLREAAELLAARQDWPALYDPEVLARNEVPCAAVAYAEDMYVELAFSQETAACIRGLKLWITNAYAHNGLRADGKRVLGRLLRMLRGEV